MESDDLILIMTGAMSIILGLGYAFVRSDERARSKDMERFGKRDLIWKLNVVLGYSFLRLGIIRWAVVIFTIAVGLVFIAVGLGWISYG